MEGPKVKWLMMMQLVLVMWWVMTIMYVLLQER